MRGRSFSRSWRRIAVWGKPIPANGPLPPRFGLAKTLRNARSGNWSARHMVQGTFFRFSTPEIAPNRAPVIASTSFPSALLSPNGDFLPWSRTRTKNARCRARRSPSKGPPYGRATGRPAFTIPSQDSGSLPPISQREAAASRSRINDLRRPAPRYGISSGTASRTHRTRTSPRDR